MYVMRRYIAVVWMNIDVPLQLHTHVRRYLSNKVLMHQRVLRGYETIYISLGSGFIDFNYLAKIAIRRNRFYFSLI